MNPYENLKTLELGNALLKRYREIIESGRTADDFAALYLYEVAAKRLIEYGNIVNRLEGKKALDDSEE